jgi:hypothetical protein
MQRIIREVITLIRIERWLVVDDRPDAPQQDGVAERVIEQIVLNSASEAQVRELFRRILEQRQWDIQRDDHNNQ